MRGNNIPNTQKEGDMNIICERIDCKYNKENNPMQKLMTCHKETIKVNKRGFCQSMEKKAKQ